MNVIDKLFDEENEDTIVLYDENDNPTEFEQLALIPHEDKMYAVLHPLGVPGCDEGEVVICYINEEEEMLTVVDDSALGDKIFGEFIKLLEEGGEE